MSPITLRKCLLQDMMTQEEMDQMRANLSLDRPVYEQYLVWMKNIVPERI
ncbi:hypothetical protein [Paenibacillus abyssi]|uniref:ABC transporter type 1 GsiC-like N-terminal domain-containing protein n=1 Tax=Paenibacillus abyssi TaxID=1340531 RepID=A0A917FYT1_9BACL|nr:hypothetical protein [Paenibacillus abyssi]GGG14529.1 hypothetical protein GCM10010916_34290 [Paenibacillus abyssi]